MTTIAVLGIGAMGLPMATNLVTHGFTVRAFDVSAERLALGAERGLATTDSVADAVTGADGLLLAVRNAAQLEAVLYGDQGAAALLKPGGYVILTSTVGMAEVENVAECLNADGLHLIDAPVSGGPVRAGEGDLLVTVGATQEAFNQAKPVLDAMSGTLVHVGNVPGKGQAMKTVNQLLCGVHIAAAGEALALAEKLDLDLEQALAALMSGAAASFMLGDRGARMIEARQGQDVEVKSRLDIFVKDMGIVTDTAKSAGLPTPVAAAAEQLYLLGAGTGRAAHDDSTIMAVVAGDQPAQN